MLAYLGAGGQEDNFDEMCMIRLEGYLKMISIKANLMDLGYQRDLSIFLDNIQLVAVKYTRLMSPYGILAAIVTQDDSEA